MLWAKNGRQSSRKSTHHLEIRYYFVTDNICRNRLSLEYCPTEEMIVDFFTKPLQGALFYKLWSLIMNLKSDESVVRVEAERTTSLIEAKECVGSSRSSEKSVRHPVRYPGGAARSACCIISTQENDHQSMRTEANRSHSF